MEKGGSKLIWDPGRRVNAWSYFINLKIFLLNNASALEIWKFWMFVRLDMYYIWYSIWKFVPIITIWSWQSTCCFRRTFSDFLHIKNFLSGGVVQLWFIGVSAKLKRRCKERRLADTLQILIHISKINIQL